VPLQSIIKRTLGIKRHGVKEIKEETEGMTVILENRKGWRLPCRHCGTLGKVRDRLKPRRWRHVPLWGISVTMVYAPARVRCPHCQKGDVEKIPWAQGKCHLTVGLIDVLARWAKWLAWEVVAKIFQVAWNTVATAVRQAVTYGLKHRELGSILCIGIDELSRKKGQVYITNVYDLEESRLIWSGEGRSRETLQVFFQEHGNALKDQVIGVGCDMWEPYMEMIREGFPQATLVLDKFHISFGIYCRRWIK